MRVTTLISTFIGFFCFFGWFSVHKSHWRWLGLAFSLERLVSLWNLLLFNLHVSPFMFYSSLFLSGVSLTLLATEHDSQ